MFYRNGWIVVHTYHDKQTCAHMQWFILAVTSAADKSSFLFSVSIVAPARVILKRILVDFFSIFVCYEWRLLIHFITANIYHSQWMQPISISYLNSDLKSILLLRSILKCFISICLWNKLFTKYRTKYGIKQTPPLKT